MRHLWHLRETIPKDSLVSKFSMRSTIVTVVGALFLLHVSLWGSLAKTYPDYRYVFAEFGIAPEYIENRAFETFVKQHEQSLRRFYKGSMNRATHFLPQVERMLLREGLSDLFIYLSMVESGFSPQATSSKKAVGLWQFMPKTAQSYHLMVNSSYDERCDIDASTQAAMEHLKRLKGKFGFWYLAILAYNCGEGRLSKAIQKAGSIEPAILLDKEARYLPKETREYLQKILLVAMIGESKRLAFSSVQKALLKVTIAGGTDLEEVAKKVKMPLSKLLRFNPQFTTSKVPKRAKKYSLYLPEEQMMRFYLSYDVEEKGFTLQSYDYLISHQVKLGETLKSIASHYQTTLVAIEEANHLESPYLELGSLLVIPVKRHRFEEASKP